MINFVKLSSFFILLSLLSITVLCSSKLSAADQSSYLASLEGFIPNANGLLITQVLANSQAAKIGLQQGDIICSYNKIPTHTVDELGKAKKQSADQKSVEIVILRKDKQHQLHIQTGAIGCHIFAVSKGKAIMLRPPATKCTFNLNQLNKHNSEQWYRFTINDKHVGFEHYVFSHDADNKRLVLRSEVAFAGGEQWGDNHFIVTVHCDDKAPFRAQAVDFRFPLGHSQTRSKRIVINDSEHWQSTFNFLDENGKKKEEHDSHPLPADGIPSYMILRLAALLERNIGNCFHYTNIIDGSGQIGAASALLVAETETINIGDKAIECIRCEVHSLQGGSQVWVDAQHRSIRMKYGANTFATLSTKAEALNGVKASLLPKD